MKQVGIREGRQENKKSQRQCSSNVCMSSGQTHLVCRKHTLPASLLYSQRNTLVTKSSGRGKGQETKSRSLGLELVTLELLSRH